jgi:hypothetical protein
MSNWNTNTTDYASNMDTASPTTYDTSNPSWSNATNLDTSLDYSGSTQPTTTLTRSSYNPTTSTSYNRGYNEGYNDALTTSTSDTTGLTDMSVGSASDLRSTSNRYDEAINRASSDRDWTTYDYDVDRANLASAQPGVYGTQSVTNTVYGEGSSVSSKPGRGWRGTAKRMANRF